jgi:hypothetical protein
MLLGGIAAQGASMVSWLVIEREAGESIIH